MAKELDPRDQQTSGSGTGPPPGEPELVLDRQAITDRRQESGRALHEALGERRSTASGTHRGIDWVIFGVTAAVAVGFIVWGLVGAASLGSSAETALGWMMTNLGWLFVLTASAFVVFVLWLALSRYGSITLGADGEKPEFHTVSWIAMMFSAGMGIGLMFFGVAEPMTFYLSPPPGTVDGETVEAARQAMATSIFHWGLHPWAIYAVVGVAIAYGTFRKGRSQLISSIFEPLFGDRVNGVGGRIINMLAIFATLFGSAASLGVGAVQIAGGITHNGWAASVSTTVLVVIIVVLTLAFILSATSGIARGIQWLANTNMVLALFLAVFVFVVGPTVFILNSVPTAIFDYLGDLPGMAARTEAVGGQAMAEWLGSWTIFYWAWWISWTPFVGMFIARISRGRTIRQFVTGVLLVPTVVSVIWFGIFGAAGIAEQQAFMADRVPAEGLETSMGVTYAADEATGSLVPGIVSESALFDLLSNYPLGSAMTVLVMVLVAIFFVSGADAASIVMGTLSEKGVTEPTRPTVIFWGAATGAVAAILLIAGGGGRGALTALQNITIVVAVPFVLIMLALMVALMKDLRSDPLMLRSRFTQQVVDEAVVEGVTREGPDFSLVPNQNGTPPERVVIGQHGARLYPDRRLGRGWLRRGRRHGRPLS